MSVIGVSNALAQAAGLLVQALEGIIFIAGTINDLLTISTSAAALIEASDSTMNGITIGFGVGVTNGSHNITYWREDGRCNLELAISITSCEVGRALADVFQGAGGADHVAGVVLTLLLAESRENLIVVNGIASLIEALCLVGDELIKLTGNVGRDYRGSRRGGHREGASGIGGIGEDSIILLENHGGEGLSCSLQEEGGEDDEKSEGLVDGAKLSAWKGETGAFGASVQVLGHGLAGKTTESRKTYRHDHPGAMDCLKGWMGEVIGLGMTIQNQGQVAE